MLTIYCVSLDMNAKYFINRCTGTLDCRGQVIFHDVFGLLLCNSSTSSDTPIHNCTSNIHPVLTTLCTCSSCTLCNQEWQDALQSCYKISTCLICFSLDNYISTCISFSITREWRLYIYPLQGPPFYTI